jgi:hypothetical protein
VPRRNSLSQSRQWIAETIQQLNALAVDIDHIHACTEHAARDGYPSSSFGGGGGTRDISDPTGTATIMAMTRPVHDPILTRSLEVLRLLGDIQRRARVLDNLRVSVMTVAEQQRGRVSSVRECDACGATVTGVGADRLRDGFGPACYRSWRRSWEGNPDPSRIVFIQRRREELKLGLIGGCGKLSSHLVGTVPA